MLANILGFLYKIACFCVDIERQILIILPAFYKYRMLAAVLCVLFLYTLFYIVFSHSLTYLIECKAYL